ncbi:hypothetical protein INR49_018438 [Caranx melampygus]|nr:hypothetical protein INR49_018438 [Caranx melampygus]
MAEPSARYQQLPNDEDAEESPQVAADAPPPYSSIAADNAGETMTHPDVSVLLGTETMATHWAALCVLYVTPILTTRRTVLSPNLHRTNVATTLPSYDEAERTKAETTVPLVTGRDEDFVTRDDFEDADQLRIGNDGIFMLTFFMAFLFNWIGFFLSFWSTTSAAGRYGAISGFGLSSSNGSS